MGQVKTKTSQNAMAPVVAPVAPSCFASLRFQDAFEAHKLGPKMRKQWRIGETGVMCTSNEQICLNDPWLCGKLRGTCVFWVLSLEDCQHEN